MSILDGLGKARTLGVLLTLSFGLNLFLAGIMAGRIGSDLMRPPPFMHGFERSMRSMPEHHRKQMFGQMRELMPQMKEQRLALAKLHQQLAEELEKPKPERAVIEQQLAAIREHMQTTQKTLHQNFVDTVLALEPQERRMMLSHIMQGGRGGSFHGMPPMRRRQGPPAPGMDVAPPTTEQPPAAEAPPESR